MTKDQDYIFTITPIQTGELLEQVALALEKRTELLARARHPKMWAHTDRLNAKKKAPEATLKKRRVFRKIAGAIQLILGVVLIVPGILDFKQSYFLLIAGLFALIVGGMALLGGRNSGKNAFLQPAKRLLQGKDQIIAGKNRILFTEKQMEIHSPGSSSVVAYEDFESIIETEDAFLLTYQGCATVLQKKDLPPEQMQAFCEFIAAHVPVIPLGR